MGFLEKQVCIDCGKSFYRLELDGRCRGCHLRFKRMLYLNRAVGRCVRCGLPFRRGEGTFEKGVGSVHKVCPKSR